MNKLFVKSLGCFVLAMTFIFFGNGNIDAQENAHSIKAIPVSQARSVNAMSEKSDSSKSQFGNEKDRMQSIRKKTEKYQSSASSSKSETSSRKTRKLNLRQKTDAYSTFKIHYSPVGTPRQMKGGVLEHAVRGSKTDRERDKDTVKNFLRSKRNILRIDDPDNELSFRWQETDALNQRHFRYSQTYGNLPVYPSELTVHLNADGDVYMMDGAFVPTPRKMVTHPVLSADDAIIRARAHVPDSEHATASKPELVIYAPGNQASRLAWKLELSSFSSGLNGVFSTPFNWLVIIDALNGKILTAYNQMKTANISGGGYDLFDNWQTLNVWEKNGTYYMTDTSKPMYNPGSSNPPNPNTTNGAIIVLDAENQPSTSNVQSLPNVEYVTSDDRTSGWLPDAVSATYNISRTYDYYRERHNRNSIDGKGGTILAIVRVGLNYENAGWVSGTDPLMIFGDAEPFAGALDVVAHELTHGVTSYTANMIYKDQPGALNEAFSDIFGEMVESYTTGSSPDWRMGTRLSKSFRSLSDPGAYDFTYGRAYPAHMNEYINTSQDNGGVHLNMTIVSHAFYLLAEGLDNAIGIRDSERIFYRALVYHLVANSQFIDARLACIASAEELFGQNSAQAVKTGEAFDAVGISVGDPTPPETPSSKPVDSDDATLFVYYDEQQGGYYLGRRESGDPEQGNILSRYSVKMSRPSVSREGDFAVFVNAYDDLCFIDTDGSTEEDCMGWDDVYSVAMSPDESLFGFVFLEENGEPGDQIAVFDLETAQEKDQVRIFDLVSPTIDGVSTNTILQADAMSFTSDNQYIIYDAYNVIHLNDGATYGAWSIYGIDLETDQTLVFMPPVEGYDIGYPALSQTNDSFITFDAFDTDTGNSTIYTLNLITGDLQPVTEVQDAWGTPGYTGDDSAIIYSEKNNNTPTGFSLMRQPLKNDRMTPQGTPSLFLENADFGTIYRREGSSNGNGDDITENGGSGCFIGAIR